MPGQASGARDTLTKTIEARFDNRGLLLCEQIDERNVRLPNESTAERETDPS